MSTVFRSLDRSNRLRQFLLAFACTLVLVLVVPRSPLVAQSPTINQAKLTQVLDSAQVFIQNKQAKLNDAANKGQRVRTGQARAQLTFNTGAIGRLAHDSVLTVGECARLQQGSLLVNGAMNGCTSSIVAGVRGTTYVLEVDETGEARVKVLEGVVTVARRQSKDPVEPDAEPTSGSKQFSLPSIIPKPSLPTPKPVSSPSPDDTNSINSTASSDEDQTDQLVLKAGEKVSISAIGAPGLVEKLTQKDFTNLLTGNLFNGFTIPLPGMTKIQASFQQLFPGVPFPIELPRIPTLPIPIRLPF